MSTTYHFSSEVLIRSCPLSTSLISHKSRTQHSLTISATKIEPMSLFLKRHKKHLEYNVMEVFIECLGRQLQYLERENKGVSSFNIDDITVFHSDEPSSSDEPSETTIQFAMTNDDKIHDIDEDHQLIIDIPYPKQYTTAETTTTTKNKGFHSPEFKEFISKKSIPYKIHFKSGYYSFGLLCIYCYVSRTTTTTTTPTDITNLLEPIINTKIYWFLKQVLQENPTNRRYICV